jgi:MFS family permease
MQIGGGVLGDIWNVEERGKASAIYSLAPLLGPVLGPVCGGWCEHSIFAPVLLSLT